MTIAGMPALNPSSPRREAVRAALVAAAGLAAGLLWVFADALTPGSVGPLAAFVMPEAAIAPRAWSLEPATWVGWAAVARSVDGLGLAWPLRLVAVALAVAAVLGVVHPGAFERPAPYYLTPLRRATAWVSALAIGYGMPGAVNTLWDGLVPDLTVRTTIQLGGAVRPGLVMALVGALIWTVAGPGVWSIRALLRFSHGALAGLAVWATCALAVLLAAPLRDVAELVSVGNVVVAVDAGRHVPGGTFGALLLATASLYGAGFALAGALAVVGAPQSMGARSRSGAAAVAAALLVVLLALGWSAGRSSAARVAEAAPDVVAALGLETSAAPRPIVLLMGDAGARLRFPPRQALAPVRLAPDCAPRPAHGDTPLPAASEANLEVLDAWLAARQGEVSGLAARVVGCRTAILARLFRPEEARAQALGDPAPARVGIFALSFAIRGLAEGPPTPATARWLATLADTARYSLSQQGRERVEAWRSAVPASFPGTVVGRLAAPDAARWRVGLVAGADPASGPDPLFLAPRNDGQVLLAMAQAVSPDATGRFEFREVAPGWYQLALLAPEGTDPARSPALSVTGDPGQFYVVVGRSVRDIGVVRISP